MNIKASGRSALIIGAGLWMCFAGPLSAAEGDALASDPTATTESTAHAPVATIKPAKHRARKPVAAHSRQSGKEASKASNARKADDAEATADDAASNRPASAASSYAPVRAGNGAADDALRAMSTQADSMLKAVRPGDSANPGSPAANTEQISADQLSDADRSLSPSFASQNSPTPSSLNQDAASQTSPTQNTSIQDAPSQDSPNQDKPPVPSLAVAVPVVQTPPVARSQPAASKVDSTWGQTSLIGKIFLAFGGLLTFASAARMFMA